MSSRIIGGIEGGATHSHVVLLDSSGRLLAKVAGLGTNHHLMGMKECLKRIAELIDQAKIAAGIPVDTPIYALGLSLSGCEETKTNQELVKGLIDGYPKLAEKYSVGSDTEGSVAATSNRGGVTCIAGTGSNTLLVNPDGSRVQCGGWGNILGDEGSAWKISFRAIKYCFDDMDNFEQPPFSTERVWNLVKEHFKIQSQAEILDSFYKNFEKAYIASLCKKLADLARNGDKLSVSIFREAGTHLARSILAVVTRADPELIQREGGIHVLCVGSVWLSWDLLRPGFVDWLQNNSCLKELSLMRLTIDMGIGAAFMAADRLNIPLERDYSKNYKVFYHFQRSRSCSAMNGSL